MMSQTMIVDINAFLLYFKLDIDNKLNNFLKITGILNNVF